MKNEPASHRRLAALGSILGIHLTWIFCPAEAQSPRPDALRPEELRAMQAGNGAFALLDVRPPWEFEIKRISGAANVPAYTMESAHLPGDRLLVLYCSSKGCPLSENSAVILRRRGYKDVQVLAGGIEAWEAAGYPVERDPKAQQKLDEAWRMSQPVAQASLEDLRSRIELGAGLQVVDVRPRAEYASGHLPHAISVPLEEIGSSLCRFSKGVEILVYDRLSKRSTAAARKLLAEGLPARLLRGGVILWASLGYPLTTQLPEEEGACRR